ncbi:MAG: hypothetical protein OXG15_07215 [Gammaproteobacteria bacterium]|nr:hypothetical protein [Gammaproteobacteria bacterium]
MCPVYFVNHFWLAHCTPGFWVLLFGWLGVLILVCVLTRQRRKRVYKKSWYDLSEEGPNEEMKWCQIRQLMESDPLKHQEDSRWPKRFLVTDIAIAILFITFFLTSLLLMQDYQNRDANAVGTYVGLSGALIAGLTIWYNVRLKSRSENRQIWINSIREEISDLIATIPPPQAYSREIDAAILKARPHFTRLELLLNPNERVHRALLTVLRFLYGMDDAKLDEMASCKLGIHGNRCEWRALDPKIATDSYLKWRSNAMRLANVLLKREWEQVKHVN